MEHELGDLLAEHYNKRLNERRAELAAIPLKDVKGRWTNWVFHCKWSSREDGLTEIWLEGKPIVKREGPNCRRTDIKFEFKMGIYKPHEWQTGSINRRVVYHDELRIGGPKARYEDVAP